MLKDKSEPHPEPHQMMVGTCQTCGTEVRCARGECSARTDPAFGMMPCVECPKVVGQWNDRTGDVTGEKCGRRIYMRAVQE